MMVALLCSSFFIATLFSGKQNGVWVEARPKRLEHVDVGTVNIQFPQTYFEEGMYLLGNIECSCL